eukprot:CAMPEP_0202442010 /NCGR_PEP_ID=MMETSP1360-20130828/1513_1 /ASSEMBLY_ACC=CAM_ASM_000848 /TAXON_ID=515479 /ORGANISM="Licmophora paradoxa, Strain CCMP2313" /LENGTH=344 /DNA_ID=CAMNT_0049057241 /DNA_START=41 /DNA_END=1075 /DNA_ORIENTATION=-
MSSCRFSFCNSLVRNAFLYLALTIVINTVSSFTLPRVLPTVSAHLTRQHVSRSSHILTSSAPIQSDETSKRKRIVSLVKKRIASVSKLFPPRQKSHEEIDYERRKQDWADRYTSVGALREVFGSNNNKLWGDLDPSTSRRLYKTLLPRALLELLKLGARPEDLAPLAYKARQAAKMYARERSIVPARVAATSYDLARQWKAYGKIQPNGITWSQLFTKYKRQVLDELGDDCFAYEDVTAKICLKILERSCQTNQRIDKWVLNDNSNSSKEIEEQARDIMIITEQLEKDVHELLRPKKRRDEKEVAATKLKVLRLLVRAKRRLEKRHPNTLPNQENVVDTETTRT